MPWIPSRDYNSSAFLSLANRRRPEWALRPLTRHRRGLRRSLLRLNSYGGQNQIFQRGDEKWRIAYRRHHPKGFDAKLLGFDASLDINFVQSFDVLGKKRERHH